MPIDELIQLQELRVSKAVHFIACSNIRANGRETAESAKLATEKRDNDTSQTDGHLKVRMNRRTSAFVALEALGGNGFDLRNELRSRDRQSACEFSRLNSQAFVAGT